MEQEENQVELWSSLSFTRLAEANSGIHVENCGQCPRIVMKEKKKSFRKAEDFGELKQTVPSIHVAVHTFNFSLN